MRGIKRLYFCSKGAKKGAPAKGKKGKGAAAGGDENLEQALSVSRTISQPC